MEKLYSLKVGIGIYASKIRGSHTHRGDPNIGGPQSRTQSSGDTPEQVRKKKIRSSSGAPENQDGGCVGNRAPHRRNNKVLRPGDSISTTRYLKLKQWGSGEPYGHTKREARSSGVNVSAWSPEVRKSKAEYAPGQGGTLKRHAPGEGGAHWGPPSRHGWELAASTGTCTSRRGPSTAKNRIAARIRRTRATTHPEIGETAMETGEQTEHSTNSSAVSNQ
ncbi:hypothetical protein NDU88_002042 [Pleurodeles waltl]|uniref:Uncharacterized protein n=1 Tax=Pleurodeles waltl TaxID=8319 RepID=A0AAV7SBT0_PLEWA|nr:hypothetical protein NDU88_002042 [Pleurodeles waltl]